MSIPVTVSVGVFDDKSSFSKILEDNFEVLGLGLESRVLGLGLESLVLALRLVSLTPSLVTVTSWYAVSIRIHKRGNTSAD